jgi:hypothetical protein
MDHSPEAIGDRLRQAAARNGIKSPTELTRAIQKKGFSVTLGGLKNHWYGTVIPNGVNCIAYAITLEISIDWLLLGQELAPTANWNDLLERFERLAAAHGLRMQRDAPWKQDFVAKLEALTDEQRDVLRNLINQFLSRRAEEA